MAESKLRSLSVDFSVNVVKMCDGIKGHHSLVNQLERSATSIGETFMRRIMRRARPILLRNFRFRSRNVMRLNIGLSYL